MRHLFYPAVLERGEGNVYAVWFPDFPGVVAAGLSVRAGKRTSSTWTMGPNESGTPPASGKFALNSGSKAIKAAR